MAESLLQELKQESKKGTKAPQSSSINTSDADNSKLEDILNQEVSPSEQSQAEAEAQIKENLKPTKDHQISSTVQSSSVSSNNSPITSSSSNTFNLFTSTSSQSSINDSSSTFDQASSNYSNSSHQVLTSNSNSTANSSSTSNNSSSSNSDLAMNAQAQKNLVKADKQPADLQDFSSPNLFVKRARKQHQKFLQGVVNAFQSQTLNKTPVVLSLVRQDTVAFENLCWGMNKVVDDNQKRNTQLETNTEKMQKKAQAGEKTLHFFEEEGIFANLLDDAKVITRVVRSPDFQAFAKKLPNNELHVPNKLEQAGEKAKNQIQAQEKQNDKKNQKGD